MNVLVLCDYPPSSGGLATQGDLLYKGFFVMHIIGHAFHFETAPKKERSSLGDHINFNGQ